VSIRGRTVREEGRIVVAKTFQTTASESKLIRQVTGWLTKEFGDHVEPDVIQRVAVNEIARLRGARVQEFVATISWRQARARLADTAVQPRLAS
jgi:hypothetical protein